MFRKVGRSLNEQTEKADPKAGLISSG